MISKCKTLGPVLFPEFTGERAYMIPIKQKEKLPNEFSRWQSTVESMLKDIEATDCIYMTIDQSMVNEGKTQRRSGPHIDGNWVEGKYKTMAWDTGPTWNTKNLETGGIILAFDFNGPKAYAGEFKGECNNGGDCSHLDLAGAKTEILKPNYAHVGNVTMIHEAMPSNATQSRIFIRLTLSENYVYAA